MIFYAATLLGLPYVPAYLALSKNQRNKISTGINYASAGSGILPETNKVNFRTKFLDWRVIYDSNIIYCLFYYLQMTLCLDKQIKFFKRTIENNLPTIFDEQEKLEKHLSESLLVVSTGVNDMSHNQTFFGSPKFASYLLQEFSLRLTVCSI